MNYSNNSRERGKLYYNAKVRPIHEKHMELKNRQWLFALYKEYWKHQWIPGTSRPRSPLWQDPMIEDRKNSRRPSIVPEYARECMLHWKHNYPEKTIEREDDSISTNFDPDEDFIATRFDDDEDADDLQHEIFQHQVHCTEENTPAISCHTSENISEYERQYQKDSEAERCSTSDKDAYDSLDEVENEEVEDVDAESLEEEENEEEGKLKVEKVDETSKPNNSKLNEDKPLVVNYILDTNVGDGDTFFSNLFESKTTQLPSLTNQKTAQCKTGLSDPDFKFTPITCQSQSPVQESNQEYDLNGNKEKCIIRKPRRGSRNPIVKEENYSFDKLDKELFKEMNYKNLNQSEHCEAKMEITTSFSKSVLHISSRRGSKTELIPGSCRSSRAQIFRGSSESSTLHSVLFDDAESFKSIEGRETPSVKVLTPLPPVQSKHPSASAKQSTDNFQEYIDSTIDEYGSDRGIYVSERNCVVNKHREYWETMDDSCEFNGLHTFQTAAHKENIYDDLKVFLGARKAKSLLSAQKRQKSHEKQAN